MHAYDKQEAPDAGSGSLALKYAGKKYIFDTNAHMARQQMDFDKFVEELPSYRRAGLVRPEFSLTVHGSGLLPFYAAMIALHADPVCNGKPKNVGGFIRCERLAA